MSNQIPSILIFGPEAAPRARSVPMSTAGSSRALVDDAGSSRVPIEAIAANLRLVMEQVNNLIRAAREPAGELRVAYVDVNLSIAVDGSVGLLGTANASAKGTLTLRLQP